MKPKTQILGLKDIIGGTIIDAVHVDPSDPEQVPMITVRMPNGEIKSLFCLTNGDWFGEWDDDGNLIAYHGNDFDEHGTYHGKAK